MWEWFINLLTAHPIPFAALGLLVGLWVILNVPPGANRGLAKVFGAAVMMLLSGFVLGHAAVNGYIKW